MEIINLEGPPSTDLCQVCQSKEFEFRCTQCYKNQVTCHACCLDMHGANPDHSIEKWTGSCWGQDDLHHMGLVLSLGHGGSLCPEQMRYDSPTDEDSSGDETVGGKVTLLVVDANGIRKRRFSYCSCPNAPPHHLQLLRHRLFPASFSHPQTVFTFSVLEYFFIDSMECKTSAGSFYSKLRRLTDGAFPHTIPVRPTSHTFPVRLTMFLTRIDTENS